jgi:hypothetical protein
MKSKFKIFTNISREKLIFGIISIIASFVALITFLWVVLNRPPGNIYGEEFVSDEITFLQTSFGALYMKPITIITVSLFVCWIFGLESLRGHLSKLSYLQKRLIFFLLAIVAFIYVYETLLQLLSWNSVYILNNGSIHVDMLHHQPNQMISKTLKPYNFVFTTKNNYFYVACSMYGMFFFYKLTNANVHKKLEE